MKCPLESKYRLCVFSSRNLLIHSLSDLLWNLFTNQRLTINTTIPTGIVNRRRKIAGLPPNKSRSIYIIGQNATHAEIIEIITILRRVLGRFMASTTRGGRIFFSTTSGSLVLITEQSLCLKVDSESHGWAEVCIRGLQCPRISNNGLLLAAQRCSC